MTHVSKHVELKKELDGKIITMTVHGKLEKEDYDHFGVELEKQMKKHGKVRILIELKDFHGWTASAAWEDCKLGFRHFNDIERIAVVGDSVWEKGATYFAKPFTVAKVKYFEQTDKNQAELWIHEA
jgi:hypothetical protein